MNNEIHIPFRTYKTFQFLKVAKSFVALLRRHWVPLGTSPSIAPDSNMRLSFILPFLAETPKEDSVGPKLVLSESSQFSPNMLSDAIVENRAKFQAI